MLTEVIIYSEIQPSAVLNSSDGSASRILVVYEGDPSSHIKRDEG